MQIEDQSAVVEFLSQPSTHGGAVVERAETHASMVFLAGQRAYKLKRAVRLRLDSIAPVTAKAAAMVVKYGTPAISVWRRIE